MKGMARYITEARAGPGYNSMAALALPLRGISAEDAVKGCP